MVWPPLPVLGYGSLNCNTSTVVIVLSLGCMLLIPHPHPKSVEFPRPGPGNHSAPLYLIREHTPSVSRHTGFRVQAFHHGVRGGVTTPQRLSPHLPSGQNGLRNTLRAATGRDSLHKRWRAGNCLWSFTCYLCSQERGPARAPGPMCKTHPPWEP